MWDWTEILQDILWSTELPSLVLGHSSLFQLNFQLTRGILFKKYNRPVALCYPERSWFLLRQMWEKPLQAIVCFSIEHAWACHTFYPMWCIWCQVHLSIFFFCWKCFGTKESKCISPKALRKERFNSHCSFVIYLLPFYENDSAVLMEKMLFLHDFYVCRPLFWLSNIAQKSQQSASKVTCTCLL